MVRTKTCPNNIKYIVEIFAQLIKNPWPKPKDPNHMTSSRSRSNIMIAGVNDRQLDANHRSAVKFIEIFIIGFRLEIFLRIWQPIVVGIELTIIINLDDNYVRPRTSHVIWIFRFGPADFWLANWPVSFYVCFNIIIWSFIFLLTKLMNNLFFNYINLFLPFPWLAIWPYFFLFVIPTYFKVEYIRGLSWSLFFKREL